MSRAALQLRALVDDDTTFYPTLGDGIFLVLEGTCESVATALQPMPTGNRIAMEFPPAQFHYDALGLKIQTMFQNDSMLSLSSELEQGCVCSAGGNVLRASLD